jgi:hypothetical protein
MCRAILTFYNAMMCPRISHQRIRRWVDRQGCSSSRRYDVLLHHGLRPLPAYQGNLKESRTASARDVSKWVRRYLPLKLISEIKKYWSIDN